MHAGKTLSFLGAIALLALAGCSTNESRPAENPVDTVIASTSAQPSRPQAGDAVEAPGVTLTVDGVSEADHLMLHADGVKRGFQPEERLDAPAGGRFVTVATTVKNTGLKSWDLTCSFALQAYIFSDEEQRFEPVNELYRLLGNPECSEDVNPGFESTMIWSFAVPDDIEITHFGFADPETHYNDLTMIDIVDAKSTTTSSAAVPTSSEATTRPVVQEPVVEKAYTDPAPVVEETYVAPQRPPFMDPEDFDPYGPPKFVQCWENNAAVMSDGSIVTDTVNCALDPAPSEVGPYGGPPRADGCVGPAAVCGYYDEYGNPIWFDKMTGETSPRYYDEYGNPTMESY